MKDDRAKIKRKELSFVEKMQKFIHAGISESLAPNRTSNEIDDIVDLEDRIKNILGLVNRDKRPATNMLFFVMYDIES
ncbi:MAG: CRISPR-associated endonuclease Cas2, partial [Parabacteroides sp.]|nr:CRISPR-associated endonuclease Cas2 [Parabacteroides sp.]